MYNYRISYSFIVIETLTVVCFVRILSFTTIQFRVFVNLVRIFYAFPGRILSHLTPIIY